MTESLSVAGDGKYELNEEAEQAGLMPAPLGKDALVQVLLIYSEAARMQYEEAEELMNLALAAKEHADALMARCADLVAMNLDEPGVLAEPTPDSYIPF